MSSGMSAERIDADWTGRVIDGQFTLLRWLGGSGPGGVFLAQLGESVQQVAVKLIPADVTHAQSVLAQWTAATRLSHPHLMPVFRAGRSSTGGRDVVYAVTEYSEEILSDILPARALTPDEAGEVLETIIAVLAWLHAQGLVHGALKPSNIMVVGDQLKLSADRIQSVGAHIGPVLPPDIHDAPDSAEKLTAAADIWSLGVLLVEALTQHPPQWDGTLTAEPLVPASVPEPFATIARECLLIGPGRRCTLAEIKNLFAGPAIPVPNPAHPAISASSIPAAMPSVDPVQPRVPEVLPAAIAEPPARIPTSPSVKISPKPVARRAPIALIAVLLLIVAVVGVIVGTRHSGPSPSHAAQTSAGTASSPPPAPTAGSVSHGAVLHRAFPKVPRSAANTIRGHVRVGVRVQVDPNGDVTNADFEARGPSRYFANLALDAARQWKFRPAQTNGRAIPSVWVLHFAFAASGTETTAEETAP
jgi:TonB family protein